MDTTPHTPRRPATRARACAAAGLILLAVGVGRLGLAQPPARPAEPAAKLGRPRPLDEPLPRVIGRGAAPDADSPVSVYPTAPASAPQPPVSRGWMVGPGYSTTKPVFGSATQPQYQYATPPTRTASQPGAAGEAKPGVVSNAWSGVKGFVTGKPAAATPSVRTTPTYAELPAARTAMTGMYAGPPAYRWYGWGTTTPGSNPYAPTGQYPRGSASWYSQTGATPGAFPVPVTANGARPAPGGEPPAYARGAEPESFAPPPPRLIAHDAPPDPHPVVAPGPVFAAPPPGPVFTVPVPPDPPPAVRAEYPPIIAQTPAPSATVLASVVVPAAADDGGPAWQRSGGEPIPFGGPPPAPATRGREPRSKDPPLEAAVREACKGHAAVTEVRQAGPRDLVVKVTAATPADARAAFAAISADPRLEAYKVEFEANLDGTK